jgi:triosephosphate isomerase
VPIIDAIKALITPNMQAPALLAQMLVAYEPIWAIGTGLVASKEDAQQVCGLIHDLFKQAFNASPAVLYGGSVKASNAYDLALSDSIQGFLVGGASLNAQDFSAIIAQTVKAKLSA